jgi:hypothetical protein
MQLRRLLTVSAVSLASMGGLAACGAEHEVKHGETEGVMVETGHLKYQVQISRILNPADWEDRDYLKGLPAGSRLGNGEDWFGVFIRVFNETGQPHPSASQFVMRDTTGKEFRPVQIDTNANPVAFRSATVAGKSQLPLPNSLGQINTTQGGLLLYKVPSGSFQNRPLVWHVKDPASSDEAEVTLDI